MIRLLPLALILILVGCAAPSPSAPDLTASAPTLRPTPTAAVVIATRTPQPGFTLLPSTPIAPAPTPTPCVNDAAFLSDVTVPDFSQLAPGATIDKRWAVKNTGSCDWNSSYRLAFIEGNQMSAAGEHALFPAKAGSEAVLQVNMIAPDVPGEYTGRWQLRDPNGSPFGPVLFIKITVIPLATTTAQP
ncbi:MAG: hypothetical protein FJ030_00095 [Chloroflexi bacterium]|nr:hypothetical protein [Chloroflexota bacterium]